MTDNDVTLSEFRQWLNGVIEMQDDEWHPNKVQWNKILLKLNTVVDTTPHNKQMVPTLPLSAVGYIAPVDFIQENTNAVPPPYRPVSVAGEGILGSFHPGSSQSADYSTPFV